MSLELGLALDFGTQQAPLADWLDSYTPILERAEKLGFHSVVAGQSLPAGPSFHLPSPLLVLAALSTRTNMGLGTGVTLMPAWGAYQLAYDGAMLDQLTRGRAYFGISVSNPGDWRRFGLDRATVGRRFDDLLQAVKTLWNGGTEFRGEHVSVEQGIWPLPVQTGGPPLLTGGLAGVSARRAALLADGYYAATQYHLEEVRRQARRYHEEVAAAGRPAGTIAMNRLLFLADSREQAFREGGEYVTSVLRRYASMGAIKHQQNGQLESVDRADPHILDRVLGRVALVGTPEDAVGWLREYEAAGVTRVLLRVRPADMPPPLVQQTVTLAGEQVLPTFR